MLKRYRTVMKESQVEIEEKKSRFISNIKPISTEEEALEFIKDIKSKYWDASHNVFAYCVNENMPVQRFSDAGEPSGTAGLPILETIKRLELQNLVVVVTRYFGGTLLGTGGLIRAYGRSATAGLEESKIIEKVLCYEVEIEVEYTLFSKLQSMIIKNGYSIKDILYKEKVLIIVYVEINYIEGFYKKLIELTNDRVNIQKKDKAYITVV